MRTIASILTVGFALTALFGLPVCAQRADPFGGEAVPADPFRKQPPPEGVAFKVVLSVVDQQNAPVLGAVINVRNSDTQNRAGTIDAALVLLRTNARGLATWLTSDQQLAKFAVLNRGMVLFSIFPPKDCGRLLFRELTQFRLFAADLSRATILKAQRNAESWLMLRLGPRRLPCPRLRSSSCWHSQVECWTRLVNQCVMHRFLLPIPAG